MAGIHGGDIYTNKVQLDFSVNINPLGIPKEVQQALKRAVGKCRQYPDINASALRHAVAECLIFRKNLCIWKWCIGTFYGGHACDKAGQSASAGSFVLWI